MKILSCVILLAFPVLVLGQSAPHWKKGVVVLSDREVITGEISFEPLQDVVLFRSPGELSVFPAHRIELFRFYDEVAEINRQFVSVQKPDRRRSIYEVVIQGDARVLRKAKTLTSPGSRDEIDKFDYFVWWNDRFEPIHKFRTKIYPLLVELHGLEIKAFVASLQLNLSEMKSALLIIKEYNRILHQGQYVAQAH